jgi:hypothetical protein
MKTRGISDQGFKRLAQFIEGDDKDKEGYSVQAVEMDADGGENFIDDFDFNPGEESQAIAKFFEQAEKYGYGKCEGLSCVEVSLKTFPGDQVLMITDNGQFKDPTNFRYESLDWDMPSLMKRSV